MSIPIIDTHQHLIYPNLSTYSWTAGYPSLAGRAYRIEDYIDAIQSTGVRTSIFMETAPDAWREEVAHIYSLAAQPGVSIAGVIASCRPEEDGFEKYLASVLNDKLVGLRRICHVESDELSQQSRFIENVRRIGRSGLTFDLCFQARQLPLAAELVKGCPETQFILDHCGVPDIDAEVIDPWRNDMRKLAALPNVACKISGVLAYCRPDNATAEAVRPYIEHSIDCFGWDRIVWGSDWPVCTLTTTLSEWVAISRTIVGSASKTEQRKLFYENAIRIYGLRFPDNDRYPI